MNQILLQYVQNQLVRAGQRLNANTVNAQGKKYPRRNIYIKIKKHIDDFLDEKSLMRWIVIPGLRGVGKTTAVSQIYFYLTQDKKVKSNNILYASLDEVTDLGGNLREVLGAYEKVLGKSYEQQNEFIFILLDEVQVDPKWASILKILHEKSKKVFIICTGSSAVELQSNADAERRAVFERLFPMSFTEFQMVRHGTYPTKGLKYDLQQALYQASSVELAFQKLQALTPAVISYWSKVDELSVAEFLKVGTLPFAMSYSDEYQVYQAINRLLEQVIGKDIRALGSFSNETLSKIKQLLFLLADSNGSLAFSTIAKALDMQRPTLNSIFDALEKTELLIRALPQGANNKRVTKPSKFLFMSPALRLALLSISGLKQTFDTQQGALLEDVVALHYYREFVTKRKASLMYDATEGGADFIVNFVQHRRIVVEVGMGNKDSKQVMKTMSRVESDYGIVISSTELRLDETNRIIFLPIQFFLLM